MKIIDCITYFNEPLLFEIRLNILNEYVDEFLVCEAKYTHAGKEKNLNFDLNKFRKFKNKINYIVVENQPKGLFDEKDAINIIEWPEILISLNVKYIKFDFTYSKDFKNRNLIISSNYNNKINDEFK